MKNIVICIVKNVRNLGDFEMKKKDLTFKEKSKEKILKTIKHVLNYIRHNKNKTKVIAGVATIVTCVGVVSILKLNDKEVLACAKSRNIILEGETITDIALSCTREIEKGPSKSYGKVVYLTIDDGPSEYTDEIIKILNKNNVKATFFMIDSNMRAHPQQVKNIVKNGNTAGFHSVSHDIHKLYKSPTTAKNEFDTNEKNFKKITGETSKVIRLPFGSKPYTPRSSYNALMDAGYKLWDWTLDTEDWRSTSPQIMKSVIKHTNDTDDAVLLMHERKQTVAVLDEMIQHFKKEGFEILPIKQCDEQRNYWNGKLFKSQK